MNNACWCYLIVSSDSQADTLDAQETWAKETAAANGWELTRIFRDVGSGNLGTRDLLVHLVAELRATPEPLRPIRLLMNRLDRVGRGKIAPSMIALDDIESMGVIIHTRLAGDESPASTPEGELIRAVRLSIARFENAVRLDKIQAGLKRRRSEGKHVGATPFGVILVAGRPVAYEPEAAIVREIYEKLAAGWGLHRIATWARGIAPPKRLPNGGERSLTWGQSTIRSLTRSELIRTLVVPPDLLERAQAARASNYRFAPTGEWEWPLRGAIWCTCGHRLMGHATGGKPYRIRYYRCRAEAHHDGEQPGHRADRLESAFLGLLQRLHAEPGDYFAPERQPATSGLEQRENAARRQVEDLDRKWRRAWKLSDDGEITGSQLRARLEQIEGDRAKALTLLEHVREEMAAAKAVVESVEALADVIDVLARDWPAMDVDLKQTVARAIASLPTVDGLWADPAHRGELFTGRDVASARRLRVMRSNATCESFLGNMKALLARAEYNA